MNRAYILFSCMFLQKKYSNNFICNKKKRIIGVRIVQYYSTSIFSTALKQDKNWRRCKYCLIFLPSNFAITKKKSCFVPVEFYIVFSRFVCVFIFVYITVFRLTILKSNSITASFLLCIAFSDLLLFYLFVFIIYIVYFISVFFVYCCYIYFSCSVTSINVFTKENHNTSMNYPQIKYLQQDFVIYSHLSTVF